MIKRKKFLAFKLTLKVFTKAISLFSSITDKFFATKCGLGSSPYFTFSLNLILILYFL